MNDTEQLKLQAQQQYKDVVGGLQVKRAELQQQIAALEQFDADYRQRLTEFIQAQLRALWAVRPKVNTQPPTSTAKREPAKPADIT